MVLRGRRKKRRMIESQYIEMYYISAGREHDMH
jgi:hypothetical protein